MTLRCEISIVPFGDEENIKQLYRLDISNIGTVRDEGFGHEICKYRVDLKGRVLDYFLTKDPDMNPWEHFDTSFILEHDRRDGAVALVEKACELMKGKA